MAAGDITAKRTNYSDFPCNVFDGVDDYVEIPHNAAQLGANLSNGFTISAWVNPRSSGEAGVGYIISKDAGSSSQLGFRFMMSGVACLFSITNINITSGNIFNLGNWQHILITCEANGAAVMYWNNTGFKSGNTNATSAITTTNAMRIGNRATATDRTFDGAIRSVKMWNRVLTTTEITEEYNGKNHQEGLIHNFKLGGDYADYGSVGVTATNSGSIANTTLPLKLQTNAKQLNLAAVTDKIICVPRPGRVGEFALIGANRAAA